MFSISPFFYSPNQTHIRETKSFHFRSFAISLLFYPQPNRLIEIVSLKDENLLDPY